MLYVVFYNTIIIYNNLLFFSVLNYLRTYLNTNTTTMTPRLREIYSPTSRTAATPAKIHLAAGLLVLNWAKNTKVGPRN